MEAIRFEYYSHDLNSVEGSVNLYRRVESGGEEYYLKAEADAETAALNEKLARLVEALKKIKCSKCRGAGWVRGYELDDPDKDTIDDTMTRYTCDWCNDLKKAIADAKGVK